MMMLAAIVPPESDRSVEGKVPKRPNGRDSTQKITKEL
jgi:hypothetical protein